MGTVSWVAVSVGLVRAATPGPLKHPLVPVRIRGLSCRGSLNVGRPAYPGTTVASEVPPRAVSKMSPLRALNEDILNEGMQVFASGVSPYGVPTEGQFSFLTARRALCPSRWWGRLGHRVTDLPFATLDEV